MRSLAFAILLFTSGAAFSQTVPVNNDPIVTFGNIPASSIVKSRTQKISVKKQEFMANPKMVSSSPDIEVAEYTFSILPTGGDFMGPFKVKGPELPKEIKDRLAAVPEGRIFIEDIHVKAGGLIRLLNPMIFYFSN